MFSTNKNPGKIVLPAGLYIIGDPCYNVPDESWDELLETSDYFQTKCIGTYTKPDGSSVTVVSFGTAYGDGVYNDGAGREYPVDAGMIGIMRFEDLPSNAEVSDGTHVVEFKKDFECYSSDGWIFFGNVEINTGDSAEEDLEEDTDSEFDF